MNSKLKFTPLALLSLAALLASGCGHQAARQSVQTPLPASPPDAPSADTKSVTTPQKTGVIYTVSQSGGDDNNLVPHTVRLAHSQSPARDALEALIHADNSPIPKGTMLRGLQIENGLATVNLSQEFQTHFHGSETEEAQTVNSVLRTLGQFPSIDRVQFLVDGKSIDALSQLPLSGPLDVIRAGAAPTAVASGGGAGG